jgi:hypothetical protein
MQASAATGTPAKEELKGVNLEAAPRPGAAGLGATGPHALFAKVLDVGADRAFQVCRVLHCSLPFFGHFGLQGAAVLRRSIPTPTVQVPARLASDRSIPHDGCDTCHDAA